MPIKFVQLERSITNYTIFLLIANESYFLIFDNAANFGEVFFWLNLKTKYYMNQSNKKKLKEILNWIQRQPDPGSMYFFGR
jgi:hypothetical protein